MTLRQFNEKLDDLLNSMHDCAEWEQEFVESLAKRRKEKPHLAASFKQEEVLASIHLRRIEEGRSASTAHDAECWSADGF